MVPTYAIPRNYPRRIFPVDAAKTGARSPLKYTNINTLLYIPVKVIYGDIDPNTVLVALRLRDHIAFLIAVNWQK